MIADAFARLYDYDTLETAAKEIRGGFLLDGDEEAVINVQNHIIYGTYEPRERSAFDNAVVMEAAAIVIEQDADAIGDVHFLSFIQTIINNESEGNEQCRVTNG